MLEGLTKPFIDWAMKDHAELRKAQDAVANDPTIRPMQLRRNGGAFGAEQTCRFWMRGGYLFHDAQCTESMCTSAGLPLHTQAGYDLTALMCEHDYAFKWKNKGWW